MAAVGATLAAVGSITRDKTLTMVGGAIGAIGAIGSLASAAGIFGSAPASTLFGPSTAASTADTSASAGSNFAEGLTPTATGEASAGVESGTFDAAGAASADAQSAGTVNFVAGMPPGTTDQTTLSAIGERIPDPSANLVPNINANTGLTNTSLPDTNSLLNQAATSTTTSTATPGTAGAIAADAAPPGTASTQASSLVNGTSPGAASGSVTGNVEAGNFDTVPGATQNSGGVFNSILKFAQDNKVVTAGILQAGGSLLSGLTSTVTPAQVGALNAQAAANNAAAALAQQQLQNLQMPKSVASSTPVTGTPGTLVPPSSGLINSAPKTGVAA